VVEGQTSWYGGNILACPVGKLVVVIRADGSRVFVRTEGWPMETFYMEIPARERLPLLLTNGSSLTSLETPAIRKLRLQMFVDPSQGRIPRDLAPFLPDTLELRVDYLNQADRRFRLRFMLTTGGEKLEFLDLKERPFQRAIDTGGPPFFIFLPDKSESPVCNKIEFFH
jgi:hypothetical protein